MVKPSPTEFLDLMLRLQHRVFVGSGKPYNLNIVGFRNPTSRPNYFDDTIAVYFKTGGVWTAKYYAATTYPGTPALLNPINRKGAAILVPGQYIGAYKLGEHKGKYLALVQDKPVQVYRDNDRDSAFDKKAETVESGLFGINIHRASRMNKWVSMSSAGCQVIQQPEDYSEFMNLCKASALHWGNSFTYTLIEL